MSTTSQQYAGLADKSYSDEYRPGIYPPDEAPGFSYEGIEYKVLEHASNARNGYQGMIFQRVDTGEIIVAHRGTEEIIKDGALTDGAMLLSRVNPQVPDAIELTERAILYAERSARDFGGHAPEVTVTGHSLGGTLAQITAHHFGLRGETFNAYGAASLGYSIDKGGDNILNHVMAGDTVSAASPHFGQVRVYASASEIAALHNCGYANDRNPLDPRAPGVAIGVLAGSHRMHHFLNEDGEGKRDRSALSDPAARQLAEVFDPMIDKFRGDVAAGRSIATVVAVVPTATRWTPLANCAARCRPANRRHVRSVAQWRRPRRLNGSRIITNSVNNSSANDFLRLTPMQGCRSSYGDRRQRTRQSRSSRTRRPNTVDLRHPRKQGRERMAWIMNGVCHRRTAGFNAMITHKRFPRTIRATRCMPLWRSVCRVWRRRRSPRSPTKPCWGE